MSGSSDGFQTKSSRASRKPSILSSRHAASSLGIGSTLSSTSSTVMLGGRILTCCPVRISAVQFTNAGIPPLSFSRPNRSEEHTSELQSLRHLVCRLLLEKKNDKN